MHYWCRAVRWIGFLALGLTSGCDSGRTEPTALPGFVADTAPRQRASKEQARAAAQLSLSGGGSAEADYNGMLKCAGSLKALGQLLENSPLIDQDQAKALTQAQAMFAARARRIGETKGKTARQASIDLTRSYDEAAEDRPAAARNAPGCIRLLAGDTRSARL